MNEVLGLDLFPATRERSIGRLIVFSYTEYQRPFSLYDLSRVMAREDTAVLFVFHFSKRARCVYNFDNKYSCRSIYIPTSYRSIYGTLCYPLISAAGAHSC